MAENYEDREEFPPQGRREFQDPHYHDEDADVPADDTPAQPRIPQAGRRKVMPRPRRRFEDDE